MSSTARRGALVALVVSLTVSGCGAEDGAAPGRPALARQALAGQPVADRGPPGETFIVGGSRAGTCQWPTAVGLSQFCTGTLVHPRVVTTAGHCLEDGGPTEVTFGETWSGSGVMRTVPVERCHDGADSGIEGDFGFCILAEEVTQVPVVPALFGCEADILQPGQGATLVGYGRRGGISFRSGIKYMVDVTINQVVGNDVYLGNSRAGGCHGDSGGPAFVRLADGSWRTFGATSRGTIFCNSQTIYTLIHPFIPWMEATAGVDLTPCHDADGSWNPGPACQAFPLDPHTSGKTWDNMCSDVQRSGAGASCGAPQAQAAAP